jgi:hypothetical protein
MQIAEACNNLKLAEGVTTQCVRNLGLINAKVGHHKRRLDHVSSDICALRTKQRDLDDSDYIKTQEFAKNIDGLLLYFNRSLDTLLTQQAQLDGEYAEHSLGCESIEGELHKAQTTIVRYRERENALRIENAECKKEVEDVQTTEQGLEGTVHDLEDTVAGLSKEVEGYRHDETVSNYTTEASMVTKAQVRNGFYWGPHLRCHHLNFITPRFLA